MECFATPVEGDPKNIFSDLISLYLGRLNSLLSTMVHSGGDIMVLVLESVEMICWSP